MTTKTTDERAEVQGRLDQITARIETRTGEIADIERRQLAAATAGEEPDPALATAKAARVDALQIDQRAAAAVRGQLDQIDAAIARERDLARLAQLRAQASEKAREAQEAADGFPTAAEAAVEALKAAAVDLVERHRRIRAAATEQERLSTAANVLAKALGEPVETGPVTYHWAGGQQVATPVDPVRGYLSRVTLPPSRDRIFHAAEKNPRATAEALGAVAAGSMPDPVNRGFSYSGGI
ncbi:hypothetical protein [Pseudonocardia adelaidensis]|uniref:Uncharacterized protein n=1 Tax=Pseudonocardia adelaidensis TaxID=648754 RepID=A0ABP9NXR9_9PSEU